jgi:uncharacterized protein YecT (DUF1311 family)
MIALASLQSIAFKRAIWGRYMQAPWHLGLLAAAIIGSFQSAHAQSFERVGDSLCDVRKLSPRDYTECLRKAQEDSDRGLRERIGAIGNIIDKTTGLQGTQKTRWKKALDDNQGLWVRFRNAECQEMVTFESGNKARIAEEQRICILDYNQRRMMEFKQRYPAL